MEKQAGDKAVINNAFYDELQDRWYSANDHPIALLRAENRLRAPWIGEELKRRFGSGAKVLDVGCGGGLLANYLALQGHHVTGIDLSANSLHIAEQKDSTKSVRYLCANAYHLPFSDESFDVVCATDILEHVENPLLLIKEASRVLKKGGRFFFHTFNRNWLSYLVIIKGVEWLVKNSPPRMHVYHLFIKPKELKRLCSGAELEVEQFFGFIPDFGKAAFWKMAFTGVVPEDFSFKFVSSLSTGYCGIAYKNGL